ncbi:MAG: glucokinase, partial [Anaerolineae bacterium]|nr:glucokinase [Anaerolineae bacterium]
MLLVGDIGGTKTDLALFSLEHNIHDEPQAELQITYKSGNYASLEDIIQEFISNNKVTP